MKHPRVAVAPFVAACAAGALSAAKSRTPFHNHTGQDNGVSYGGETEIRRGLQTMDVEAVDWSKVPRVGLTNHILLCTRASSSSHVRPACLGSSTVVEAFEADQRVTGKYIRPLADVVLYLIHSRGSYPREDFLARTIPANSCQLSVSRAAA